MRSPDQRFGMLRIVSISTGIAILSLVGTTGASQAQFGGSFGGFSMGSRGGPMFGGGQRRSNRSGGMHKSQGGEGSKMNRHPGQHGSRTGHGRRPHGFNPGFDVDTGIAIGTIISRGVADPPPPAMTPPPRSRRGGPSGPASSVAINIPPNNEPRFVKDEVVLEFAANIPPPVVAQLLARHRMALLESQVFPLSNTTIVRARITNRLAVRTALRRLRGEVALITGQPNYLYRGAQQTGTEITIAPPPGETPRPTPVVASAGARSAAGDPAQYALAKLRLNEAHSLANGDKILVAVIDSGIDLGHPELQGVIAGSFDALGKPEKPHAHGTAIAGVIAAHARLLGAAPAARLLAIRAFGAAGASAEATTIAILKGIDHAAAKQARVINMSFAGPADPALSRHLAAARAKGVVLIAASGNFGPKSPAQYPAADPNVIAVSATDANDKLFRASNIGPHIAVSAPGVDILLPAPNNDYQLTSGTSFSAAYVSGVVALVLQRAPTLTPDAVRKILVSTAKDLGPRGKDNQYGAGLVDAYQAVMSLQTNTASGAPPLPAAKPAAIQ